MNIRLKQKKWEEKKKKLEQKYNLFNDKKTFYSNHKYFKLPSVSKILIFLLFINCTIVQLFTGWMTIQSFNLARETLITPDFTPMISLIGAIVGQTIGYAIYSLKAMKENTSGGIVYQQVMKQDQPVG